MALYESPKWEVDDDDDDTRLSVEDQKFVDDMAYQMNLRMKFLIDKKKELESAKNWEINQKETLERIKQSGLMEGFKDTLMMKKKAEMSFNEFNQGIKRSLAARVSAREGKVIVEEDRSMFTVDIEAYAAVVDDFKAHVKSSCTAHSTHDSVADKLTKTDFFKTDESSTSTPPVVDPAEFSEGCC